MKGFVPAFCSYPGSYTKSLLGEFQVPCALIIGTRKPSTDLKTVEQCFTRIYDVAV
jgi:2,3,4,5-tetrahydropyridine-2-carboxylate N-succinyltransferase